MWAVVLAKTEPEAIWVTTNSVGAKLDPMISERLFGLQVEARANTRTGEDFVYAARTEAPTRDWIRVTIYTASMSASITVEVQLQKRGWKRQEAE